MSEPKAEKKKENRGLTLAKGLAQYFNGLGFYGQAATGMLPGQAADLGKLECLRGKEKIKRALKSGPKAA